jgi:hypothetical protein
MRARRLGRILLAGVICSLAACNSGGGGAPPVISTSTPQPSTGPSLASVQRISSDPFTNSGSQHATEVEPSAASSGGTVVAAFQTGRFYDFGSSDIGIATSLDGGITWQSTTLPGTTHYTIPAGPYDSISDPSVAYDARHASWLVVALPVLFAYTGTPGVVVSHSSDGLTWSAPAAVTAATQTDNDKSWIACDNHPSSPYYGHCYVEWDNANVAPAGLIDMAVSSDGGLTWGATTHPQGSIGGLGGQPLVLPDGSVVVLFDTLDTTQIYGFVSHDGGATWSAPALVQTIVDHAVAGNLRYVPFVSAAQDASGKIYAVWQDCRFRQNCTSNDLVLITSTDGVQWSSPARVPIDAAASTVDHFLPGLAVDASTSGAGAHIGITYYSYADANCTPSTCALSANFIASADGGTTWGAPQLLAGPMSVSWLASTRLGQMIGDYTAAAFANGTPIAIAPIAVPATNGALNEAIYAPKPAYLTVQSVLRRSSIGERPVRGAHSDHGPRRIIP